MKIAILHNYMDTIGGAEKVALTLARELNADVYSTCVDKKVIEQLGFGDIAKNVHSLGNVPKSFPSRQMACGKLFHDLRLSGYDFYIIDGDWAMYAAPNHKPNLWYVHSPIREIWDLCAFAKSNIKNPDYQIFFDSWVKEQQERNLDIVNHIGEIVCNSETTKARVERYLKKSATVISPPIETSVFKTGEKGDYWLSVNRLSRHKRIEMQMEAFDKMPNERLIIVGSYDKRRVYQSTYARVLEGIQPPNVEIRSWVDQQELIDLYANCKGFITTSMDEDFGMNVVEAMAAGKSVIAPNEGGYKESIINGKTGILIDDIDSQKIVAAVQAFDFMDFKDEDCIARAQEFSAEEFMKKIRLQLSLS